MKASERATAEGLLCTDQYQLTMAQLYFRAGGGLAEDVCVLATVLDARKAGFAVYINAAVVHPVTSAGRGEAAVAMQTAGAVIIAPRPTERAA